MTDTGVLRIHVSSDLSGVWSSTGEQYSRGSDGDARFCYLALSLSLELLFC